MLELLGYAMAVQFKPHRLLGAERRNGEFVYRRDQIGPALPATQAERDRHVRRYGWIMLSSVPLLGALVLAGSFAAAGYFGGGLTNLQEILVAFPVAIGPMVATYLYLKWFSHAPAREFAGRTPVGPPLTLADVYGRQIARSGGYGRIAMVTLILMGICAFPALSVDVPAGELLATVLVMMTIPLAIGLGASWSRWRIERSAR